MSESSERLAIRRPPRALDRLMSPFMVTGVDWRGLAWTGWSKGPGCGMVAGNLAVSTDGSFGQGGGAVAGAGARDW